MSIIARYSIFSRLSSVGKTLLDFVTFRRLHKPDCAVLPEELLFLLPDRCVPTLQPWSYFAPQNVWLLLDGLTVPHALFLLLLF